MSATAYIYGLLDPRDRQLRYVGRTFNPKARLSCHVTEIHVTAKNKKVKWVRELLGLKLSPKMVIFDEVDIKDCVRAERETIARYRALGCPLFNVRAGGGAIQIRSDKLAEHLSCNVSIGLREFYKDMARRERRTLSGMIRLALRDYAIAEGYDA